MSLKNFLSSQDEEKEEEFFWALVLEPEWVAAGIWQIKKEAVEVLTVTPPSAWELQEELVGAVDSVLSAASQSLPEDALKLSKTVFGVTSSWISKGQIKGEYLEKIKRICSKLSLEPVGFVVLAEAVAHFLKSEEGSPLNAVVVGITKDEIEVSLFKSGNLLGKSQVARSVSLVDDVTEGLARFEEGQTIPSRFILYDGREKELEEVRQALLKADWADFEWLKLLHTPKIEVISPERKVNAVCFAGASELSEVNTLIARQAPSRVVSRPAVAPIAEEEVDEERKVEEVISREEVKPEDVGFVIGKDVAQQKSFPEDETEAELQGARAKEGVEAVEVQEGFARVKPEAEAFERKGQPKWKLPFRKVPLFAMVKSVSARILSALKSAHMKLKPEVRLGKRPLFYGVIFLGVLLVSGLAFWWYYPRAEITIYLSTKRLDEEVTITVDPAQVQANIAEAILPGEVLETEVSGEKTRSATGTKTVGERARGEATLYRVGTGLTLTSGTILHAPGGFRFTLDDDVTVASGSAGTPGTSRAKVTAEDIGAQYNLASGTTFGVGNYSSSDIEAKNDAAFSGGTSREISAVSADDVTILEEELHEELEDAALGEFSKGLPEDKLFIEESLTATPSSRIFSNKVGDEASTLKLSLAISAKALAVDKRALINLAKEVLADKVPEGFVLREDQIETDFEFERQTNGAFTLEVKLSANLLPEVKSEAVAEEIAGRYPAIAEKYLTEQVPGFVRAEMRIKPRLPGKLGTLPRIVKHIEVEIAAER